MSIQVNKPMRCFMVLLMIVPLLSGCLSASGGLEPSPYAKGSPVVFIYPLVDIYRDATVGVLPFQMPANIRPGQGEAVGSLFRDVLLAKRNFKKIILLQEHYGEIDEAIKAGASAKVDLVLAGRVNHAFTGGAMGGDRVDVTVRLVNVSTGNTIWHVAQTVEQPLDYPRTDFMGRLTDALTFPAVRPVDQPPAVPNMLVKVAEDISNVIAGAKNVAR